MKDEVAARTILIAGPTAGGKSALALALAEQLGGVVINSDSMQVYGELAILTARPSDAEMRAVPHALYGHVAAREAYSAGRFVTECKAAIDDARVAGRIPIIVGGTGLYFKALLEGLSPIPSVPDDVRAHWRGEAERLGGGALHLELERRDPTMAARLNASDTQRIVRALEVLTATGRSLADWQTLPGTPVVDKSRAIKLVVTRPRDDLHARAALRFDRMMAEGALREVERLCAQGLDDDLPAMRALGVRSLRAHLVGRATLAEATAAAKAETRQFIKRQETWLRRHMITWIAVNEQQMQTIDAAFLSFIQS